MNAQVFSEVVVRSIPWILLAAILLLPDTEPVGYHPKRYRMKRKLKYVKGGKIDNA